MSARRALALAVRDQLKKATLSGGLALTQAECEVMMDGKPPAQFGGMGGKKAFYSVHQGPRRNAKSDPDDATCLEDVHTLFVTVSMWCGPVPQDRLGVALVELVTTGFDPRMDALRACLTVAQNQIRIDANTILGVNAEPFSQPLIVGEDSEPSEADYGWFGCLAPEGVNTRATVGVKSTLRLYGALRCQNIESAVP